LSMFKIFAHCVFLSICGQFREKQDWIALGGIGHRFTNTIQKLY
jgi:hypothetical protein